MSEQKRKGKHKVLRILSTVELFAGIATFLCGLLLVFLVCWTIIVRSGVKVRGLDTIAFFVLTVGVSSMVLFWPVAVFGLVLSIFALFFGRDMRSRLQPLILVLAGILIYTVCYAIMYFI
ncbi:MAG: hypothetical protein ACYSW3_05090 [Planctomycetota bacterium]|jgi:uncharacterized membrane protein YhiD involved in acid resistance